jgi:hypothetical protein
LNTDFNFAFLCEFERVTLQYQQYLHQSCPIGDDHRRVIAEGGSILDVYKGRNKNYLLINSLLFLNIHNFFNGFDNVELAYVLVEVAI